MTADLLAFGAHPDDVELCCGGWLALAAGRGQRVVVADLTRGELATNGTVEVRAAEAAEAARVLGVARIGLGLPDGGVSDRDDDQVAAVVAALRTHRPALALAPFTEARHPDHAAASALVRRACFFAGLVRYRPELGPPHRPRRLVLYPERHDTAASFVVDVTAAWDLKRAAVACHASQFQGAATSLTSRLGLDAFEVRDRYWGASIGVAYGEPYVLVGPVPIFDPVAHFEAHPDVPVWVPR